MMNAIPPMRADQPLSVTFTLLPPDWNVLIEVLHRAPYYLAAQMLAAIHEKAMATPLDDAIRETEDHANQDAA
jgi:hypothetical protein